MKKKGKQRPGNWVPSFEDQLAIADVEGTSPPDTVGLVSYLLKTNNSS